MPPFDERDDSGDIIPDSIIPQSAEIDRAVSRRMMQRAFTPDTNKLVIPIVFHVMYTDITAIDNISDEQIIGALKLVNEQFSATGVKGNPKIITKQGQWITSDTTRDGQERVNTNIRFELAKRTPTGAATNGIDRVYAGGLAGYKEYGIKNSGGTKGASDLQVKALSSWDTKKYCNVYIVSEINGNDAKGGVIGYAFLPQTSTSAIDAVVVQHTGVGTKAFAANGTSNYSYENCLTHELGHYLSLYHTFDNTTRCGVPEANPLTTGDRVADTPPTTKTSSCLAPPLCTKAPFGNYMSYSPHQYCQNMETVGFTPGQSARMRTQIAMYRSGLFNNGALTPPVNMDAGIELIGGTNTCNLKYSGLIAKVTNLGVTTLTSVVLNGLSYTVSIAQGKSQSITLPDIPLPVLGVNTFKLTLTKINGVDDTVVSNNVKAIDLKRIIGVNITVTLVTDWHGSEDSWQILNGAGEIVESATGFPDKCQGINTKLICLERGTYTCVLKDTYGDATAGSWTNGKPVSACKAGFKLVDSAGFIIKELGPCWCNAQALSSADCGRNCGTFSFQFTIQ